MNSISLQDFIPWNQVQKDLAFQLRAIMDSRDEDTIKAEIERLQESLDELRTKKYAEEMKVVKMINEAAPTLESVVKELHEMKPGDTVVITDSPNFIYSSEDENENDGQKTLLSQFLKIFDKNFTWLPAQIPCPNALRCCWHSPRQHFPGNINREWDSERDGMPEKLEELGFSKGDFRFIVTLIANVVYLSDQQTYSDFCGWKITIHRLGN